MAALLSTAYESDVYADYKYKDEYDELSARQILLFVHIQL